MDRSITSKNISHLNAAFNMGWKWNISVSVLAGLLLAAACKKDDNDKNGSFSTTPEIALVSASPLEVIEFQDSVIVIISFRDGDGDLGRQNPDNESLYIMDSRMENPERYHLPPIIPDDAKLKTQGTIRIFVPTLFLTGSGNQEPTVLSIKVQDQAGHWSNEIQTPQILVKRKEP